MKNHWIETHELKNLRIWHIDDVEQWWYSAATKEEALEMHLIEMTEDDDIEGIEITEVSPDAILFIRDEDDRTAKEWASEGKGLVASTLF